MLTFEFLASSSSSYTAAAFFSLSWKGKKKFKGRIKNSFVGSLLRISLDCQLRVSYFFSSVVTFLDQKSRQLLMALLPPSTKREQKFWMCFSPIISTQLFFVAVKLLN